MQNLELTIIIISFNTKAILKDCIADCIRASEGLDYEIIIVDNDSKDGSFSMVKSTFPEIKLIQSGGNLGFAAANNIAYKEAQPSEFILLLNSDAFIKGDGLKIALDIMKKNKELGLLGGCLVGPEGQWQPSARSFPSVFNDFVTYTGLSTKFPKSKIFGKPDLTYKNQDEEIYCDWVPGAFALLRKAALGEHIFDERFFLYSEEVDMCLQIKKEGWKILYSPEVEIIHIGGASTKSLSDSLISETGKQLVLWKYQSQYLFYRKNYGYFKAGISLLVQSFWNWLHAMKNRGLKKAEASLQLNSILKKAWKNTNGGKVSPQRPWTN